MNEWHDYESRMSRLRKRRFKTMALVLGLAVIAVVLATIVPTFLDSIASTN